MDVQRHIFYWIAAFVIIGIFCAIFLPGSDQLENCQKDDPHIPFYQPVGDGYYSELRQFIHHGVGPSRTSPVIEEVLLLMNQSVLKEPDYDGHHPPNNLLWAWFEFIGHDMFLSLNSSHNDFTTPRIDASQLYGITTERALAIRRLDGSGKLRSSLSPHLDAGDDELFPYDTLSQTFDMVDDRGLQKVLVNALYNLWLREHNFWCTRLKLDNPLYGENDLYETAKHIVTGEIQAITYEEALPILLGRDLFPYCYSGPNRDARIYEEWAVGSLPVFDSFVPDLIITRDQYTNSIIDETAYYTPTPVDIWTQGISSVLLGSLQQASEPRDLFFIDPLISDTALVQSRLFQIPSYQAMYKHYFDRMLTHCKTHIHSTVVCEALDSVYSPVEGPNGIDLFIGLLSENRMGASLLGLVGTHLFIDQFEDIKNSDPYFYTSNFAVQNYRAEIHHVRLAKILLRNTNIHHAYLGANAFRL
jgi:hypothetical protein